MSKGVRIDLTGQIFGSKRVLSFREQNKHGHSVWNIVCDNCGRQSTSLAQSLRNLFPCRYCSPKLKAPRPNRRKRPYEYTYNCLVSRTKRVGRTAAAKRHSVFITYEQFAELTKTKECHYCGNAIMWHEYHIKGQSTAGNLDRKNSDLPYTLDNIVVCCPRCNKAKNTLFTYEEWKQIGTLIRSWSTAPP